VLASVNAGSLAEPGSGVEVANARPGYLEYLVPIVERRRANASGDELPIVDNLVGYQLPDGSSFTDMEAAVQMLGVFIGGTETVPKIVAHGLWELGRLPTRWRRCVPIWIRTCPSHVRR
jgi:cytochrome P450